MKIEEIIKIIHRTKLKILSTQDLKKLLNISSDNTLYKTIEKLIYKEILGSLKKGLYTFELTSVDDFQTANYLYTPSYISLESALNFHGILSQFPYTLTSITTRKTQKYEIEGREFEYSHIQKTLFFGYRKENNFLMALPYKAFLDEIYLVSKGLRSINLDELDYSKIDLASFHKSAKKIRSIPFQKQLKHIAKYIGSS